MHRVVAAAEDDDSLVGVQTRVAHVDPHHRRPRPGLAEVRRAYAPFDDRVVLVRDIQRVVCVAAAAHAEDDVDEIAQPRFDDAIVVAICHHRHDVAVDAVELERCFRVKVVHRQVYQVFLRYEGPELLTGVASDRVHRALVRCRVYHYVGNRRGTAVNDGGRLGVQRIAHLLNDCGRGVEVFIANVFAVYPPNDVLNAWLSIGPGQAEVRRRE